MILQSTIITSATTEGSPWIRESILDERIDFRRSCSSCSGEPSTAPLGGSFASRDLLRLNVEPFQFCLESRERLSRCVPIQNFLSALRIWLATLNLCRANRTTTTRFHDDRTLAYANGVFAEFLDFLQFTAGRVVFIVRGQD